MLCSSPLLIVVFLAPPHPPRFLPFFFRMEKLRIQEDEHKRRLVEATAEVELAGSAQHLSPFYLSPRLIIPFLHALLPRGARLRQKPESGLRRRTKFCDRRSRRNLAGCASRPRPRPQPSWSAALSSSGP